MLDPGFKGSAAIVADGVSELTLSGFAIVGDRAEMKSDWYLPLKEAAFADYYTDNGIVIRNSTNVTIRGVRFSRIRAFPIIVNATSQVADRFGHDRRFRHAESRRAQQHHGRNSD